MENAHDSFRCPAPISPLSPRGLSAALALGCLLLVALTPRTVAIDLLARYPTPLRVGDTANARPWDFTTADIFQVSRFKFEVKKDLLVELGPSHLGIGHCPDGAVWAVLLPQAGGRLLSSATNQPETIEHVWLRFHPREISRLFPPESVAPCEATGFEPTMRLIANAKMRASWQSGGRAMIPEPKDLTVDIDTTQGPRRFFAVDAAAGTARYLDAFAQRSVKLPPPITAPLAEQTFDQLWKAFDQEYAMFTLRPEVDWLKLREEFRPKGLQSKSTLEFASICARMLNPLRDLHVWLTVAGTDIPVFNRPREANANPGALRVIFPTVNQAGRSVRWAMTPDKAGYVGIAGWSEADIPNQVDKVIEEMRDTRGLIVDVRLNGGGSEPLARQVAGRFLDKEFVYAYSQNRISPAHTALSEKRARKVVPRDPWRYDRPVILLIGQKCMSSTESFIAMMTGGTNVTTMGDRTCGSSGNPKIIRLPLEMTVSVPRWIDYRPDGTPLDERGFEPQVRFTPKPGAFAGSRDDLLAAAIERLARLPLPDKPISGPRWVPEEARAATLK